MNAAELDRIGYQLDPVAFAQEILEFTPDLRQREVLMAGAKRLLLNCSRQWGKSSTAAAVAAHRAFCYPGSLVVCVSPTERQTGELVRKIRGFLSRAGVALRGDGGNRVSLLLPNGSRVVGLPGTEATVRGYSAASLVVIDEAARVSDELYQSVRPMLAVSGGDLICMSTPFGQRGFCWKEWELGGEGWMRVSVKATDFDRILPAFLEEERQKQGEDWFAQEYLCSFVGMENEAFRREWLLTAKAEGLRYRALIV